MAGGRIGLLYHIPSPPTATSPSCATPPPWLMAKLIYNADLDKRFHLRDRSPEGIEHGVKECSLSNQHVTTILTLRESYFRDFLEMLWLEIYRQEGNPQTYR